VTYAFALCAFAIVAAAAAAGALWCRSNGALAARDQALREREGRVEFALAASHAGLWDWERRSGSLHLSPRFMQLLGFREGDLPHRADRVVGLVHWDDRGWAARELVRQVRVAGSFELRVRMRTGSGEYRWYDVRGRSVADPGGRMSRLAGSLTDITERKAAEAALFEERDRLRVTLESIGDAVIATDTAGAVQYLNPAAEALTGWDEADLAEAPVASVCVLVDDGTDLRLLDNTRLPNEVWRLGMRDPISLVRRDGERIAVNARIAPLRDAHRQVAGHVVVLRDVSQERRHAADLAYQASHDALTGLINRREFDARLRAALDSARDSNRSHAVLYLDLDQFKVVNDTSGHAAGDELIRQIGPLLSGRLSPRDTLARLGGDEFGILLEDRSTEESVAIAEALRDTVLRFRFVWNGQPFTLGVSIGIVNVRDTALTPTAVMSLADAACNLAKEKGRNRVELYRPDDAQIVRRRGEMEWVGRIREALAADTFCL
jgi:diguanylate cyclase (GGDEF)-like protein/PAS domain S-box-containing protein